MNKTFIFLFKASITLVLLIQYLFTYNDIALADDNITSSADSYISKESKKNEIENDKDKENDSATTKKEVTLAVCEEGQSKHLPLIESKGFLLIEKEVHYLELITNDELLKKFQLFQKDNQLDYVILETNQKTKNTRIKLKLNNEKDIIDLKEVEKSSNGKKIKGDTKYHLLINKKCLHHNLSPKDNDTSKNKDKKMDEENSVSTRKDSHHTTTQTNLNNKTRVSTDANTDNFQANQNASKSSINAPQQSNQKVNSEKQNASKSINEAKAQSSDNNTKSNIKPSKPSEVKTDSKDKQTPNFDREADHEKKQSKSTNSENKQLKVNKNKYIYFGAIILIAIIAIVSIHVINRKSG